MGSLSPVKQQVGNGVFHICWHWEVVGWHISMAWCQAIWHLLPISRGRPVILHLVRGIKLKGIWSVVGPKNISRFCLLLGNIMKVVL